MLALEDSIVPAFQQFIQGRRAGDRIVALPFDLHEVLCRMTPFDMEYVSCAPIGSNDGSSETHSLAKPRVVLADDNKRMREAIADVLSTKCKVELVGCALDGAQAIDAVLRWRPEILILDISMPVLDGIQVTRLLGKINSPTKVIFLTGFLDSSFQGAAMEAGGHAYVFKTQLSTDLPLAITAVMTGGTFLSARSTRREHNLLL